MPDQVLDNVPSLCQCSIEQKCRKLVNITIKEFTSQSIKKPRIIEQKCRKLVNITMKEFTSQSIKNRLVIF